MLTLQESLLSSSRRQAAAATPTPSESQHAVKIGCFSAVFQLFSKYQNSNKRLTFGRKQGKRKPSSPAKSKCSSEKEKKLDAKDLSCDIKPSKSLTPWPEIRQSHAASSSDDYRTSSSLLMKLIGLEDFGKAVANRPALEEDSVTEKRKQLLQALEKCNEDLETLKRIINAVQNSEVRLQLPHPTVQTDTRHCRNGNEVSPEVDVVAKDLNIPVDMAEELTRSPIDMTSTVHNDTAGAKYDHKPAREPGEGNERNITKSLNKCSFYYSIKPCSLLLLRRRPLAVAEWGCVSRGMVESVEEVCWEIGWGEKGEIGNIGLVVQDHLWRELIQELVLELEKSCSLHHLPLPLHHCKRRLCF
ncbi:uncharacterized protein LOC127265244 [Andrographis paniculata]|uniref:uncharacterized protein LOC127265244 n=1 Tax=Andrographis paniculata TaxID=175694 RepID=UPI0021E8029A|nr:uncharacterized protein LOC127265244 [Andrographis paniculata]